MQRRPLIFVVILVLVVALVYSSISAFNGFARPNEAPGTAVCKVLDDGKGNSVQKCCWTETDPNDPEGIELYYCQFCDKNGNTCLPKYPNPRPATTPPPSGPVAPLQDGVLEQPPTPPPSGPAAPLQGGVLEQLEQGKVTPGFVPGFLQRQEQQQPPTDQETGSEVPRTVEPLPPTCTPGSVFDPRINECVLENPPELCPDGSIPQSGGPGGAQPECPPSEAEQPQAEQPEAEEEEQQSSSEEEDGSSEDNSNNN